MTFFQELIEHLEVLSNDHGFAAYRIFPSLCGHLLCCTNLLEHEDVELLYSNTCWSHRTMIEKFFRSSFSTLILWRINKPSLILFGDIYPTRSTFQHRKQSASNHNVEKSTLKRLILHKKCSFASGLSQFEFCHTFQAKNNRYSKMQAGWEYRAEKSGKIQIVTILKRIS